LAETSALLFKLTMTKPSAIGFRSLENRTGFLSGLYSDLLENGIRYFFPGATLERVSQGAEEMPGLLGAVPSGGQVEFEWMGSGYSLTSSSNKLSDHERRLLRSIGMVLSARYQLLTNEELAAQSFQLFRGLPEDRFVSAFLDPTPYSPQQRRSYRRTSGSRCRCDRGPAHQQHEHV
jgi:hypothetical protein